MNNTDAATSNNQPIPSPKPKYKPKPPKNGRKLARKKRGCNDRKRSSYNHAVAKDVLGLDDNANDQQIISVVMREEASALPPPLPPSPDKKAVKRKNKKLKANVDTLLKGHVINLKKIASKDTKIYSQKKVIKELTEQLKSEKKASREVIQNAWEDAENMMNEASVMMDVAKAKEKKTEEKILLEKERCDKAMRSERRSSKTKQQAAMKKLHDKHDEVLRVNGSKYNTEKVRFACTCV